LRGEEEPMETPTPACAAVAAITRTMPGNGSETPDGV
jgi:hypothetical protein